MHPPMHMSTNTTMRSVNSWHSIIDLVYNNPFEEEPSPRLRVWWTIGGYPWATRRVPASLLVRRNSEPAFGADY